MRLFTRFRLIANRSFDLGTLIKTWTKAGSFSSGCNQVMRKGGKENDRPSVNTLLIRALRDNLSFLVKMNFTGVGPKMEELFLF